jgi:hypothetical protein
LFFHFTLKKQFPLASFTPPHLHIQLLNYIKIMIIFLILFYYFRRFLMKRTNSLIVAALIVLTAMPVVQASEKETKHAQEKIEAPFSSEKVFGQSVIGSLIGCIGGFVGGMLFGTNLNSSAAIGTTIGATAGAVRGYFQEKRRVNKTKFPSKAETALEEIIDGAMHTTLLANTTLVLGDFIYPNRFSYRNTNVISNKARLLGALGGLIGLGITYASTRARLDQLKKQRNEIIHTAV